jgi:hypothetical protein
MLAVTPTMLGDAFIALVGAMLVLMIVLHAYAHWTIRDIDRDQGVSPSSDRPRLLKRR